MRVRNTLVRSLGSVLSALLLLLAVVPARAAAAEILLRPPTSAAVLDPFRPPNGPYGAGNRGIEYDTSPGDPIVAAGTGTVVFAGPVAGELHITVDHGAGLKSSYSFVDAILVARGDAVDAGELIAIAASGFHFGTRVDGLYVDPASLFGSRVVSVELVKGGGADVRDRFGDLVERSERLHYLEVGGKPTQGGGLSMAVRAGLRAIGIGGSEILEAVDATQTGLTVVKRRRGPRNCIPRGRPCARRIPACL